MHSLAAPVRAVFSLALAILLVAGLSPVATTAYAAPDETGTTETSVIGEAATLDESAAEGSGELSADSALSAVGTSAAADDEPLPEVLPVETGDGGAETLATELQAGEWTYSLDDNGDAVIEGYTGSATSVAIPSTLDGATVRTIGARVDGFDDVASITFPATVTAIQTSAFVGLWDLESVSFPADSQLETIGSTAFANTGLSTFVMPSSLRTIGDGAFHGCPNLTTIVFNDGLEPLMSSNSISGTYNFESPYAIARYSEVDFVVPATSQNFSTDGKALLSKDGSILYELSTKYATGTYTLPSTVTEIAVQAFVAQEGLTGVVLPEGPETIHAWAFSYSGIESIVIPDSVTTIYWGAFMQCESLASAVIGEGVTELGKEEYGQNIFYGCTSLSSVTLGESLRLINRACFAETALVSIDIPASVTTIAYGAFGDIPTLRTVTGAEGLEYIYGYAFRGAAISSFPFGDNLIKVVSTAFYGCSSFDEAYPSYLAKDYEGDWARSDSFGTLRITGTELYGYAYQVLDLVNEQRAAAGLSALTMDAELLEAAMQRAAETAVYWDHTRPDGTDCFTVSSKAMGENIAAGQSSPTSVMNSWMNSSGHRANILGSNYRSIGIGCYQASDGTLRWVQLFGTSAANATSGQNDVTTTREVNVDLSFFEPSFTVSIDATMQGDWFCLDLGQSTTPAIYLTNSGWGRPAVENSSFTWESSNTAHVSVTNGGTMSGVDHGTATVSLSFGWATGALRVMSGHTPNGVYSDVEGHWGEGWAMAATEAGLMSGYTDDNGVSIGIFGIEDNVTRAQLATILYRHANPDSTATTDPAAYEENETGMDDVEDREFYTAAINWAYSAGIMTGDEDPDTGAPLYTMRPDDPVSRQEAATMIARYAAYCGVDTSADPSVYASAPDASEVMEFARASVAWCYEMGIMTGYSDTGMLCPFDPTIRAAIAKMAVVTAEIIG